MTWPIGQGHRHWTRSYSYGMWSAGYESYTKSGGGGDDKTIGVRKMGEGGMVHR